MRARIRTLSLGALAGVVLVAMLGAGGFPSRPTFQQVTVRGTGARDLFLNSTDSPADERLYRFRANGTGQLQIGTVTDDLSGAANALVVDRTGTTVDSIALTATAITLNGVASSDFARLSQANTFTGSAQAISHATPQLDLIETDAAANNRRWDYGASGEQFQMRAINDALDTASAWVTVNRTATTIDTVNLAATAVQTNGVDATAASGTYVATVVGCTTSPTVTAVYRKMGNIVTLRVPPVTCTSNATSLSFSGAPALITPTTGDASTVQTAYGGINNAVTEYGPIACNMATTGSVVCARNSSQTGFTASGSKGFGNALQLTYGLL